MKLTEALKEKFRRDAEGRIAARADRFMRDFGSLGRFGASPAGRLDDPTSMLLARQTELVIAQNYNRKYPELKARKFVPISNEGKGKTHGRVRTFEKVGFAQFLASYADDLPRSDVKGTESTFPFKRFGEAYGYNLDELELAATAGESLDAMKGEATRRSMEVLVDRVFAVGDTALGLYGLLTQPNATTYATPAGAGAGTEWSGKTSLEILADMIGLCESIVAATNEVETPDTLLIPRAHWLIISTTPMFAGSANLETILDWFNRYYRGSEDEPVSVKVGSWNRLATAGSGGVARMIAYRNQETHIKGYLPEEFTQLEPEKRNLEWVINCIGKIGSVVSFYPLSVAYADGI